MFFSAWAKARRRTFIGQVYNIGRAIAMGMRKRRRRAARPTENPVHVQLDNLIT